MMIAIPIENGKLCSHFGHCSQFALLQTDAVTHAMTTRQDLEAPPHEPGLLPAWLSEHGVNLVLCGGIGPRALDLFAQKGIEVITGAPIEEPEVLVAAHFQGILKTSANSCDH
ncbi:MAG: NifB/NifX family molybdenum-iron cluster-binding protein [Alphaproteobacteria bacterium]|nr:NifB/NifX family molybdenum-iron cluster-binding protein [Alphaproteobacteria bacterium]